MEGPCPPDGLGTAAVTSGAWEWSRSCEISPVRPQLARSWWGSRGPLWEEGRGDSRRLARALLGNLVPSKEGSRPGHEKGPLRIVVVTGSPKQARMAVRRTTSQPTFGPWYPPAENPLEEGRGSVTAIVGLPPPRPPGEGLSRPGLDPGSHGWMEEKKQNEASASAGHGICESGLGPAGESRTLATGGPGFPPRVRSGCSPGQGSLGASSPRRCCQGATGWLVGCAQVLRPPRATRLSLWLRTTVFSGLGK